jgi:hypothetical protein
MRKLVVLEVDVADYQDDPAYWDWATLIDCLPEQVTVIGSDDGDGVEAETIKDLMQKSN